jgi:hypothetical protein
LIIGVEFGNDNVIDRAEHCSILRVTRLEEAPIQR